MVILYQIKYLQHLENLTMHWLGPYKINYFINGCFSQMQDLAGKEVQGLVNGSRLKLYRDSRPTKSQWLQHNK
jgi:hypothetical protein